MLPNLDILIFLVTFTISALAIKMWNKIDKSRGRCYPPSLPVLPLVGSLPFMKNFYNIAEFLMEKSFQLGPVFTFQVGSKLVLALNSKEVIEDALVKNSRSFAFRPEFYIINTINPERKGIGVMNTTSEWKKIHQNALSIMKEFGFGVKNLMESRILEEVNAMTEYARKKEGKPFDPKELAFLMTSNLTLNILFGRRRPYDLGTSQFVSESETYAYCADMVFDIVPFLRFIPPFSRKVSMMADCDKKLNVITEEEIEKSLQEEANESFVRRHIENEGPNYDREQLRYLLRDLIFGGTDTVAAFFRWSLVAMANHRDIQHKLQKEIDSVIPRDRLPTLQDEKDLHYVSAAILELQRWRTLTPLSVARFIPNDSTFENYFIPGGTLVFPNLYAAHNNSRVWNQPEVFRPDRFLDKDNNVIDKDRVISFGLGRRSCFGEALARSEMFLFFTSLVQRFVILPPEGQVLVGDKSHLPVSLVNHPEPFSIRLIERQ